MLTHTHTHTRVYNAVTFSDPYKQCLRCSGWVTGYLVIPEGHGLSPLVPCEHQSDYRDVCSSWGPVDGCRCAQFPWGVDHGVPFPVEGQVL
jgi:hypothetical protein